MAFASFTPRRLGLQERYQLAQAQCGSMPLITLVVSLPNDTHQGELRRQIMLNCEALLALHPILSATIDKRLTRHPCWKPHNPQRRSGRTIVDTEICFADGVDEIAAIEDRKGQSLDLDNGPLWRVGIYRTTLEAGDGQFVALTICHLLTDGMGALDLLRRILPNGLDHSKITPSKPSQLPPKAEDRIEFYQSKAERRKIRQAGSNDRYRLDSFMKDRDAWPTENDILERRSSQVKHKSIDFGPNYPGQILDGLKSYYRNTTVPGSVHSVLHTAAVVALAAVGRRPSTLTWGLGNQSVKLISTETPMSLRSYRLGHPSFGGNYVAPISKSFPTSEFGTCDVGEFTGRYKMDLDLPETNEDARRRVSALQWIPDKRHPGERRKIMLSPLPRVFLPTMFKALRVPPTPIPEAGHEVVPEPTGWEEYLAQQVRSQTPYRASLGISNLGVFRSREVDKIWFCHTSMPWGVALNIDVVSCTDDMQGDEDMELTVMVSWLDGVIENKTVERFIQAFAMVVNKFAWAGNHSPEASFALQKLLLKDLV